MTVRRTQMQIADVALTASCRWRNPDTNADEFRTVLNVSGNVAAKVTGENFGDGVRVHAFQRGVNTIDLDVKRIACGNDAVFDFDDTIDLRDGFGDFRRKLMQ